MDQAFTVLRKFARDHNTRLADIAEALVSRRVSPPAIFESHRPT
jgi:hypothetical protein